MLFLKVTLLIFLNIFSVKSLDIEPWLKDLWQSDQNQGDENQNKPDWKYQKNDKKTALKASNNLYHPSRFNSFAKIIKQSSQAVVEIYAFHITKNSVINPYMHDPAYDFFKFFNNFPMQSQVQQSSGSGVIITADGIVATCAHVVKGADSIKIRLNHGLEYTAKIMLIDDNEDLAILKIVKNDNDIKFSYLEVEDIDNHEVGDVVVAMGNAFGLGQTVTSGIISAPLRAVKDKVVIQTDASVNPGNSGGALINMNGKLIGIPNAIFSKSGGFHGVGFCRPAILMQSILDHFLGKSKQGWLGIYVQKLTSDMIKAIGDEHVNAPQGVIILDLHNKSPAKEQGLLAGDVILKINDHLIINEYDFYYRQQLINNDEKVTLTLWRKGKIENIKFKSILAPKHDKVEKFRITGINLSLIHI
jgi:S1-C subfamily serine protease